MRPRAGRRPLDAALIYARRGWPVFPCQSPSSLGGCSCHHEDCGSPAKHPRIQGGLRAATTEEAQVRQWWGRWPDANVAVRTGAVSGLVVLDVDPDHGGDDSLERISDRFGPLPDGRLVRTGSGGRHFYFAHPGGTVRNDAGRRLGPGLDIRGDGGYVIAPPSRHASGGSYVLEERGQLIPELPCWLLELLRPPPMPIRNLVRPNGQPANPDRWTRAAVDGELHRLRSATVGTRNDTLNRIAFRLGQIVRTGRLDEATAERLLLDGALAIGLGEREALSTVHSGLEAGEGRARPHMEPPGAEMP
ncbi:MAG: bifunctional DNA primase/polymerase [Actinobacteria bacterium]|nr:bifunctional DNA primase/polymerase [Actinomycetota bacterium]